MKIKSRLSGAAAPFAIAVMLAAQPAVAQEEDAEVPVTGPTEETVEGADENAIIVTGSRIRRLNLESTVPITSIGGDSIFQSGDPNIGETLNELPQLRSTFAQQNPGLGIGIAGLSLLDLRGLGTQRTLVLVNGRRHVPADILNNAVSPDISSIPNDLIERVDIVTGGNSAIYGSDAIAGVVNFVLRREFEGLQIRGQAGIADGGFGGNQYVSAMYGHNFADDRANITLHGEYARQERVFASDIPEFRTQGGFFVVDTDSGGLPGNSDGFPDRVLFDDIRSATIHYNGLVPIQNGAAAPCGTGTAPNNGGANSLGTPFNCTYIFTPDGRLIPQTGARFGAGPLGSIAGGNGQTGREGETLSILPFLERYNFNVLAHYEFSEAFELFIEGKWNRVNALGNNAGPSFIQGQVTQFDFRERPRLDNPFLHPADSTLLTNLILDSGFEAHLNNRRALNSDGACTTAEVVARTCRFSLARNLVDVGLRDEEFQRDTFRIVGGLRGTFNDDWSYEISANYGQFREDITTQGFINRQRFVLSMDAGLDPVTNTIRCRSQFDPAAAIALQRTVTPTQAAGNAASLAADIAACVPYNPFGQSADNRAAIDYFSLTTNQRSGIDQLVISGFVSGDSSQLFELPGGPVRFAVGGEYRKEEAFYNQDDFVTNGFTNGVSIPDFEADFEVKEVFGEIQIPILADVPFFEELSISGAARYADYQGSTGSVWSYNAGVDWAPIQDLRFRGNYSRAVRAPNVSETAFPLVPNFAPGFRDPCSPSRINSGSSSRAANCQADIGANLGTVTDSTYSLGIVSGSNPNLTEETSNSWTIGAVIQPRFIPGLSLSVDYYDITVNDIIASLGAEAIVNSCYDSASTDNVFCDQFERFAGPGVGPSGELPGNILFNSLIVAPLNFAKRERVGIDVNLAYRTDITDDVRLNTNLIYTHNLKISNFQDPVDTDLEDRLLGQLGDPVDEFRWDVDLTHGPFTLGYRLRYIGPMWVNNYEDFNEFEGACLPTGCPPFDADWATPRKYPAITYSDIRFEWDIENGAGIANNLRFYVGVDNVFDRMPPLRSTATGAGSAIYDFRGRSFYAGFRAQM